MFIFTTKINRSRVVAGLLALAVLCGGVWGLGQVLFSPGDAVSALGASPRLKTNEDRLEYLAGYGWQVNSEPVSVEELLIPEEFDESYDDYLALQSAQGFDLTDYAGKRVKRYTYEITNYPTGEAGVQANLMIYRNTVIGGEVLSPQMDGFLHGLSMPAGS